MPILDQNPGDVTGNLYITLVRLTTVFMFSTNNLQVMTGASKRDRPAPHYKELPPGEFNGIMPESLPI